MVVDISVQVILFIVHSCGRVCVIAIQAGFTVVEVVEMLPRVSAHHIDLVTIEVVTVICKELKHIVVVLGVTDVVSTYSGGNRVIDKAPIPFDRSSDIVARSAVSTHPEVKLKVFKAVNLIVDGSADGHPQIVRIVMTGLILHRV